MHRRNTGIKLLCMSVTIGTIPFLTSPTSLSAQNKPEPSPAENGRIEGSKKKAKTTKPKIDSKSAKTNAKQTNDASAAEPNENSQAADAEPGSPTKRDSEQTARRIGIGLNAGFLYIGAGGGLEGWFSPSDRLDLGLRVVGGRAKMTASGDADLLETADINLMQVSAYTRFFVGQSFYVLGGLGYNTFSGSYGVTINKTKKEVLLPMKASSLSLNIGLGNMWRWDNGFTLGFDWIGYSSFTGMKVSLEDPKTDEEKAVFDVFRSIPSGGDPEKKAKDLLMKNNLYALLMTLGYRF